MAELDLESGAIQRWTTPDSEPITHLRATEDASAIYMVSGEPFGAESAESGTGSTPRANPSSRTP